MLEDVEKTTVDTAPVIEFGSDAIAQSLRDLGFDYIALNPGASYRGLHDSLVNYLKNRNPQMLVCLHEEHAVALAHGYAKVTDRPMAVALHSNVGLMHGLMAIFNAFCDRVPMLVLGATGPIDAEQRRPWIEWLHTLADNGALLRGYTKWDDTPASVGSAITAIARAFSLTSTRPSAPTYVCLDATIQEQKLAPNAKLHSALGVRPARPPAAEGAVVREIAALTDGAKRPLILAGRSTRSEQSWNDRVRLAERLNAPVLTNAKFGAAFPSEHRLSALPPTTYRSNDALELIRDADVVLSLDWLDLGGMLGSAKFPEGHRPVIISVSADERLHNGFSRDHFDFPRTDLSVNADPEAVVRDLLDALGAPKAPKENHRAPVAAKAATAAAKREGSGIILGDIAECVAAVQARRPTTIVKTPTGWPASTLLLRHPLDYLGASDGGEGIGSGPGIAIGAGVALRGSGRIPIAINGDGDVSMSLNALWTAAHYSIPVLVIVANNGSYLNDEIHQHLVAQMRGRPVENRWIGQQTMDPRTDLAAVARAQGVIGYGPVEDRAELKTIIERAVKDVESGKPALIDVRIAIEMERPK
jgi:acetolactate synthase I/II/III large subunit